MSFNIQESNPGDKRNPFIKSIPKINVKFKLSAMQILTDVDAAAKVDASC
jgi:hypothetical protein